jgi:thiol-disulfide isomerase/thioredoxin
MGMYNPLKMFELLNKLKIIMQKFIALLIAIVLLSNISFGQQIRKVKIEDVIHLMDTSTAPLVVNFWASWCIPCIHEIPWFEKNVAAMKEKGVKLVLVSLDFAEDYPSRIAAFAKAQKYQSTIVWLNETDANTFCPKIDKSWQGVIPVSVMVNNKKHYRKFYGEQIPEPQLKLALQELIK